MDKPAVANVDTNMGYPAGMQAEKQQVAREDLRQGYRLSVAQLCAGGSGYTQPRFPEGIVDQPAAIKAARAGAAIVIGGPEHGCGDPDAGVGRNTRYAGRYPRGRCRGAACTASRCQSCKAQCNPEK